MDRIKAMKLMSEIKLYLTAGNPVWDVDEIAEACDMGIEALRNEINCVKCVHYTERETYTGIKGVCKMDTAHREVLISRQSAINAIENTDCELSQKDWDELTDAIIALPSVDRQTDEEDQLKFYYVESIDDYWIGRRLDNFYYADWHEGLGFVWSKSRYLLWGEHVVDENTLWKEHTYPSEPVEIPFTDWIDGFVKKYFAEPKTGHWVIHDEVKNIYGGIYIECSECGTKFVTQTLEDERFCRNCGARMRCEEENGKWIPVSEALPSKGQAVLDIDDKETWGDKGTWDVDKQRGR